MLEKGLIDDCYLNQSLFTTQCIQYLNLDKFLVLPIEYGNALAKFVPLTIKVWRYKFFGTRDDKLLPSRVIMTDRFSSLAREISKGLERLHRDILSSCR